MVELTDACGHTELREWLKWLLYDLFSTTFYAIRLAARRPQLYSVATDGVGDLMRHTRPRAHQGSGRSASHQITGMLGHRDSKKSLVTSVRIRG